MAQQEPRRSLPERVAGWYYSHGLFCSSHPIAVISIAITIVLLCCYPLLNLPLPGNVPLRLWTAGNSSHPGEFNSSANQDSQLPRWFTGPPHVYVQQVVMRTTVAPWTDDLLLTDAFRAPLAQVFQLIEIIRNYQHENSSKTLSNLCLHVEAVKVRSDKKPAVLPEYNCLLLSPAGLWEQNGETFQDDSTILTTIFGYQNLQKGKISLAEMLFGMNMKETGIKHYPLRARQRVLQYAVTLVLQDNDENFLDGLRLKLTSLYPLHQHPPSNETASDPSSPPQTLHIYYPGQFHYREFLPLAITYSCLFLYVYFSVRKIELVKSKIGMAFSAMATVLASLSMSIGLCFFFGLTLSLNGKEIYPYIVVIVGLENVLVLTKSVVSTPMHLDVKIRVAQGLSREGWSITKNLLTEVTILTIGLFTFVPAIQEFCIFAVVGLLSDFFLQMLFFSTVLAIDIRRMELTSDYARISSNNVTVDPRRRFRQPYSQATSRAIGRSKSHPKLTGLAAYPTNVIASYNSAPTSEKIPKRLRLVHFWARTRIFQRMFMVSMVVWISVISYSSFPVEQLFPVASDSGLQNLEKKQNIGPMYDKLAAHIDVNKEFLSEDRIKDLHRLSPAQREAFLNDIKRIHTLEQERKMTATSAPVMPAKLEVVSVSTEDLGRLRHAGVDPWQRLSNYHWPAILSMYNMTLSGHYISLLPAIRLSHVVRPEQARAARNHREKQAQHFQWQALAAALDPIDFTEGSDSGKSGSSPAGSGSQEAPFVPTSPMELFLTAVLCVVSVFVLAYTMVVLYGCVCTRNYAEWRTSWKDKDNVHEAASQVVMEAVPLVLEGHPQDIECLTTDGALLVSSDLSGQLRVWDSLSGETLAIIDRRNYFASLRKTVADCEQEDLPLSDYESGSPPSSSETLPAAPLRKRQAIFNHLDTLKLRHNATRHSENQRDKRSDSFFGRPINTRLNDRENYPPVETSESRNNLSNYNNAFWNLPDLSPAINTNFTSQVSRDNQVNSVAKAINADAALVGSDHPNCLCSDKVIGGGFDYGEKYRHIYDEHCKYLASDCETTPSTNGLDVENRYPTRDVRETSFNSQHFRNNSYDFNCRQTNRLSDVSNCTSISDDNLSRSLNSLSGENNASSEPCNNTLDCGNVPNVVWGTSPSETRPALSLVRDNQAPPIWCLDCCENLVAIGCSNGRLEFWEGSTGTFKCLFEDGSGVGVTHVRIIGNRVIAAKLSGCLDFLELESYSHGQPMDWGFTSHKRTHVRTGSAGSAIDWDAMVARKGAAEDIRCIRLNTTRAHQQPITVLDSEGGRVLTGSQDHTLKVYRLEDQLPLYTLHGHCGPITCLFIDRISPMMSGSGSQDGLLCVWDLLTGACMYSIQAHSGSVSALTYSASYVISLGSDERLCVWERFQGHLLNTIQVSHTYCTSMTMLTHNLLITSKQGSLVVWDVRTGDPVRMVTLGHADSCVFVKQVVLLSDSIACDYGNQLRVVRFPLVADKND